MMFFMVVFSLVIMLMRATGVRVSFGVWLLIVIISFGGWGAVAGLRELDDRALRWSNEATSTAGTADPTMTPNPLRSIDPLPLPSQPASEPVNSR